MWHFLQNWFPYFFDRHPQKALFRKRHRNPKLFWLRHSLIWFLCFNCLGLVFVPILVKAQGVSQLQQQEDQVIRDLVLPASPPPPVYVPQPDGPAYESAPIYDPEPSYGPESTPAAGGSSTASSAPGNPSQSGAQTANQPRQAPPKIEYRLEFNRSPVVGNRLRLQGVYPKIQLAFSRPQSWTVKSAKAIVRYQHSPALLGDRSHLVVRVNDTSIGSVPLDRPNSQIGQAIFNIPVSLLQDSNDISMLAEQQTSDTCTNSADPMLWTEILPDSKIVFEFEPKPATLNFSRYPYPFLDQYGLEPSQLAYLRPETVSAEWLTAASRFQASAGRLADLRSLDTQVIASLDQVKKNQGLLIIGTPAEQPILSSLTLPFPLQNGQLLDGNKQTLPGDVGVLMMTTIRDKTAPVLIATGNSSEAVLKAVQFLVQSPDRQLATGQAVTVTNLTQVDAPDPRVWAGYLPPQNEFQLQELTTLDGKGFTDVTVHGSNAPLIKVPFRALPDDRLLHGSTMTLHYSHSPQLNSRKSAVEVKLDDVTIGSKRLTGRGEDDTFNVNLPPHLIKPNSVLGVNFILQPEQPGICGLAEDQQLWGTLHADTRFKLQRDNVVKLPNLELLKAGFPLAAPQDLSATAVVLPENPSDADIKTLLSFSERMGRLSRAESVKLTAYTGEVPTEVRNQQNVVAIGTRSRFPIPEVFEPASQGLALASGFLRQWKQGQLQTLPDKEGVVKAIPSPWSRDRVLLALTSQTDEGMRDLQDLFNREPLFSQLRGDTVLISRNQPDPNPYDSGGYNLQFLQQAQPRQIQNTTFLRRVVLFFQDNWWLLLLGIVLLALLLYSFSQLFMNRVA